MPSVRGTYHLPSVRTAPEDEKVNTPATAGKSAADSLERQLQK
jgi:hypothetical protein